MPNIGIDIQENELIQLKFDSADKKNEGFYDKWVGFGIPLKETDGNTLIGKQDIKTYTKDTSKSSIYGFSRHVIDFKNTMVSLNDDGGLYIEKTIGNRNFVGYFDMANKDFYTAEAKLSGGSIQYEPIDNIELAQSVITSGMIASELASNRTLQRNLSSVYQSYSPDSSIKVKNEDFSPLINSVGTISKAVYDKYFSVSDGKPQNFEFNHINYVLTPDILDNAKPSNVVFGTKEASYFKDVKEIEIKKTLVKSPLEALDKYSISDERLEERRNFLATRSEVLTPWVIDCLTTAYHKILENRILAEQGAKVTPVKISLAGPSGTGKSYNIETFAAILGLPMRTIQCHANSQVSDFEYQKVLSDKGTELSPSPAIETARYGGVLNMDEFYNIQRVDAVSSAITSIIKAGEYKEVDGKLHDVHPDSVFFFTGNLGYSNFKSQSAERTLNALDKTIYVPPYGAEDMFKIGMHNTQLFIDTLRSKKPEFGKTIDQAEYEEVMRSLCEVIGEYNTRIMNQHRDSTVKQKTKEAYIDIRHIPAVVHKAMRKAEIAQQVGDTGLTWKKAMYDVLTEPQDNQLIVQELLEANPGAIGEFVGLMGNRANSGAISSSPNPKTTLAELLLSNTTNSSSEDEFWN